MAGDLAAYLEALGIDGIPPPTLETLREVHRRHLELVPYENLGIMLGRPPSVAPETCLARVAATGLAGYCFHQNGALEAALLGLGFAVERRHGHVYSDVADRWTGVLNHLALVVTGLASGDNLDGRWWCDVGLGDAFLEPLPLVAGDHREAGATYAMSDVTPSAWSFRHDPSGSFAGLEVTSGPVDRAVVENAHRALSTPPDGRFTRGLVVLRRRADGVDMVRWCTLVRRGPAGCEESDLTSYDDWRDALEVLRLPVADVPDDALRAMHERALRQHDTWVAEGRR